MVKVSECPLRCYYRSFQVHRNPRGAINSLPTLSWRYTKLPADFIKNWNTSAVSTTMWMVETQLCKLRGTSDIYKNYRSPVFEDIICECTVTYNNVTSLHHLAMLLLVDLEVEICAIYAGAKLWKRAIPVLLHALLLRAWQDRNRRAFGCLLLYGRFLHCCSLGPKD